MKRKYVRVRSVNVTPSHEIASGLRVQRLVSALTWLAEPRRTGERRWSRGSSMTTPASLPLLGPSAASAWTRRRALIPARQWNSLTGKRANARTAWRRAMLFA
jgi:hypothetical protein